MLNVAITGVHAGTQRTAGVAVARSLHRTSSYKLTLIEYDNLATGIHLPIFAEKNLLEWPDTPAGLLDQIKQVHQKSPLDVFIPCLNADIEYATHITSELSSLGISTLLPSKEAWLSRKKSNLQRFTSNIGLQHPAEVVCDSSESLADALHQTTYPCVMKGSECGVFPIHDPSLAEYYQQYCLVNHGFPVIVQEWVEGEEYSIAGLCDRRSRLIQTVTTKKIGITDDGETWMSVTVESENIQRIAKQFVELLQWVGPFELDIILSNGNYMLLDANSQFPSWIDGIDNPNLPLLAVDLAMDRNPVVGNHCKPGTVLYKDFEDHCFLLADL